MYFILSPKHNNNDEKVCLISQQLGTTI